MDNRQRYLPLILQKAQQYGIDPKLALALIKQESGFNPNAKSSAGATGLFQLMPGTARSLGVDPTDPAQNIDGGMHYLANQIKHYGSVDKALEAYNGGPGAVQYFDKHGGVFYNPNAPANSWANQTGAYVKNVEAMAGNSSSVPQTTGGNTAGSAGSASAALSNVTPNLPMQQYNPSDLAAIGYNGTNMPSGDPTTTAQQYIQSMQAEQAANASANTPTALPNPMADQIQQTINNGANVNVNPPTPQASDNGTPALDIVKNLGDIWQHGPANLAYTNDAGVAGAGPGWGSTTGDLLTGMAHMAGGAFLGGVAGSELPIVGNAAGAYLGGMGGAAESGAASSLQQNRIAGQQQDFGQALGQGGIQAGVAAIPVVGQELSPLLRAGVNAGLHGAAAAGATVAGQAVQQGTMTPNIDWGQVGQAGVLGGAGGAVMSALHTPTPEQLKSSIKASNPALQRAIDKVVDQGGLSTKVGQINDLTTGSVPAGDNASIVSRLAVQDGVKPGNPADSVMPTKGLAGSQSMLERLRGQAMGGNGLLQEPGPTAADNALARLRGQASGTLLESPEQTRLKGLMGPVTEDTAKEQFNSLQKVNQDYNKTSNKLSNQEPVEGTPSTVSGNIPSPAPVPPGEQPAMSFSTTLPKNRLNAMVGRLMMTEGLEPSEIQVISQGNEHTVNVVKPDFGPETNAAIEAARDQYKQTISNPTVDQKSALGDFMQQKRAIVQGGSLDPVPGGMTPKELKSFVKAQPQAEAIPEPVPAIPTQAEAPQATAGVPTASTAPEASPTVGAEAPTERVPVGQELVQKGGRGFNWIGSSINDVATKFPDAAELIGEPHTVSIGGEDRVVYPQDTMQRFSELAQANEANRDVPEKLQAMSYQHEANIVGNRSSKSLTNINDKSMTPFGFAEGPHGIAVVGRNSEGNIVTQYLDAHHNGGSGMYDLPQAMGEGTGRIEAGKGKLIDPVKSQQAREMQSRIKSLVDVAPKDPDVKKLDKMFKKGSVKDFSAIQAHLGDMAVRGKLANLLKQIEPIVGPC